MPLPLGADPRGPGLLVEAQPRHQRLQGLNSPPQHNLKAWAAEPRVTQQGGSGFRMCVISEHSLLVAKVCSIGGRSCCFNTFWNLYLLSPLTSLIGGSSSNRRKVWRMKLALTSQLSNIV